MAETAREIGKAPSSQDYVTGIDGLRAIAVLSVLVYHLNETFLPGGFAGVDLFFVISGFVVSMATSGLQAPSLGRLILAFYRRRVLRIVPAALTFLVVAQGLGALFVPIISRVTTPDFTAVAATAGLSNVILWLKAGDYFSPGTVLNLFTHTWSLAVEEQFYVLFPFFAAPVLLGAHPIRRKLGIVALALLSLASLAVAALVTAKNPSFAFYMLPTRLWELAAGMLLFTAIGKPGGERSRTPPNSPLISGLSVAGLALLILSLVLVSPKRFPFPDAIAPVLAAMTMIYVVTRAPGSMLSRALSLPLMRYFGRISYSLYLWHWGVIVLMRWTIGLAGPVEIAAAVLLSIGLAHLSYRFVERPVRSSVHIAARPDWQVIAAGLAAIAIAAAALLAIALVRPNISLSKTGDLNVWLASTQAGGGPCRVVRHKSGDESVGVLYDFVVEGCPSKAENPRIYVVGDSHAWAYQRLFGNLGRLEGLHSSIQMAPGCAVLPVNTVTPQVAAVCEAFLGRTLRELTASVRPGDVVFLPGLRVERYREYWMADLAPAPPPRVYSEAMIEAETKRLSALLDKGARVIIEAPKPVYTVAAFRCSDWFNAMNPFCRMPAGTAVEEQARRAPAMALIAAVRRREPRIEVLDPFPLLCPGVTCTPMLRGMPVAVDGDHASGWTNDYMTPVVSKLISQGAVNPK